MAVEQVKPVNYSIHGYKMTANEFIATMKELIAHMTKEESYDRVIISLTIDLSQMCDSSGNVVEWV